MRRILLLLAVICCSTALAQEATTADSTVVVKSERIASQTSYPEGVYATMEDFLAKKPSNPIATAPLQPKNFYGYALTEPAEVCFFYYRFGSSSDTKIRAFAISYRGSLYFQIKHILKKKDKRGRSEEHMNPNMFVQVISEGENYIYTESDFGNGWSMGLAANHYGGNMRGSYERMGVVWDKANKVFLIMKFCEDFNEFIKPLNHEYVRTCAKNERPSLEIMRSALREINGQ